MEKSPEVKKRRNHHRKADPQSIRLLDFGAKACGPCRAMHKVLDEFAKRHPEIPVERYELDTKDEGKDVKILGEEIEAVPTLVFMQGKQELKRVVGYVGIRELETAAAHAQEQVVVSRGESSRRSAGS